MVRCGSRVCLPDVATQVHDPPVVTGLDIYSPQQIYMSVYTLALIKAREKGGNLIDAVPVSYPVRIIPNCTMPGIPGLERHDGMDVVN